MHVLFWSELFWPYVGGPEILALRLLSALKARGYEFTVITSHGHLELPDEAKCHGIPVYRFHFRSALANGTIDRLTTDRRRAAQLKRDIKPDLIYVNGIGPSSLLNLETSDPHLAPLIVTLHTVHGNVGRNATGERQTLVQRILRSATWVTCVSAAVLEDARKLVPEVTPSSSIIYNGLELPNISPRPLPFHPPRLLCLGRLVAEKGFDRALTALSLLSGRFPDLRLVIAGDGPARQALQEQAFGLGVGDRVQFTGWVPPDRVSKLINTATGVLIPSRREGFPLVGIQAAQMARPIVATRVGGLPELVVHEKTGLLVDGDDVHSLTAAIACLLSRPDRAAHMGEAGRRMVEEHFSLESCISNYDTLFKKICPHKSMN